MDPVSAAASIAGIIQLSAQSISVCQNYIAKARGAREEISTLQNEVRSLEKVMQKLQELVEAKDSKFVVSGAVQKDVLDPCREELQRLLSKLEPSGFNRLRLKPLIWPLASSSIQKTTNSLQRYRDTLNIALNVDQA